MIKCDLHIHSRFSDGQLTIAEIVDLYGKQGYGAIAITDHLCEDKNLIGRVSHELKYSLNRHTFTSYVTELKLQATRAWLQYRMLLIPGFEITKNSFINQRSAHLLVLGSYKFIDPNLDIETILLLAREEKALCIAAHPFYTGEFEFQTFYLWSRREHFKNLIDAWEVNYRSSISSEVLNSGLPLIASSDFHRPKHFASWKTKLAALRTQNSVFKAVREQRIDFFHENELPLMPFKHTATTVAPLKTQML